MTKYLSITDAPLVSLLTQIKAVFRWDTALILFRFFTKKLFSYSSIRNNILTLGKNLPRFSRHA
jgi:hypothetical protein